MRILIITQAVDESDLFLGFFVGWLRAFSERFDRIEVICLKEGTHLLPANVIVHSLGKESGAGRFTYVTRFFCYSWALRGSYDAVFVHMNQEYVLLGTLIWRVLGKRVYLWRNHQAGNFLTTLAAMLANATFCTSRFSYIATYRKNTLMPVGVDIDAFTTLPSLARKPRSILFYARFAPSKRPDLLIEALGTLKKNGVDFTASIYGSPLPADTAYAEAVQARSRSLGLDERVTFFPGQPHADGPRIYAAHDIFVNLAASGMYDKTIFEAAACGCLVLAASRDFADHVDPMFVCAEDGSDLAQKLSAILTLDPEKKTAGTKALSAFAANNSLKKLAAELRARM